MLSGVLDWVIANKMWLLAIGGPIVLLVIILKMVNPN